MEKKKYDKPQLNSRQIALGVFGSYGEDQDDHDGCGGRRRNHHGGHHGGWGWFWKDSVPAPVVSVHGLNLTMK